MITCGHTLLVESCEMVNVCGYCFVACVITIVSIGSADICTNQWDLSVEGIDNSELAIHHSSTKAGGKAGELTHLVWHWRSLVSTFTASCIFWLTEHRGHFDGGFIADPENVDADIIPPSFVWSLANGILAVTTHGDIKGLNSFPEWSISICNDQLVWGLTVNEDLYVHYNGVNESRSLDDSWNVYGRFKRQAEFPAMPAHPRSDSSLATWWRRFVESIGASQQGEDRARSWIVDLTEMLLKIVISSFQNHRRQPSIPPSDPDAEMVPDSRRFRDVEPLTEPSRPVRFPKHISQSNL